MRSKRFPFVLLTFFAVASVGSAASRVDFARDVLPVLSDNCFACHGPDANKGRKGDLRLDDERDVKRDRDGHRVVSEGSPDASELVDRIESRDPDDQMPPPDSGKNLTPGQIATLRRWIAEGAQWGRHWAFESVVKPDVAGGDLHPIDVFVDRKLREFDFSPNARADRNTLARRLLLDLTGLPPSEDQLTRFLNDRKPGAWERLVDATLDSSTYGERMAWDWLEAARYADSNGYQGDRERTMWPWRDWVVRAFNDNLPYDQFTIWQLAGDLLPKASHEQILATGFNRNHMINGEGGRIAEENRVDYVFDMTETMGTVWLGLTLNCCRCHDHKFDPITQREYYQFTAFFNQTPVDGKGGNAKTPPILDVPSEEEKTAIAKAMTVATSANAAVAGRIKILDQAQPEWESRMLASVAANTSGGWTKLRAVKATAKRQTLEIDADDGVLATGVFPPDDEYVVEYSMKGGTVSTFRLDAKRHDSMPKGGLSRNDSGNFVLSDIRFEMVDAASDAKVLPIVSAEATFEQGGLKVAKAIDSDPASGWGVWDGKAVDRDHAAVFRLKVPVFVKDGARLRVTLKFNSTAKYHLIGYFTLSSAPDAGPGLDIVDAELAGLLGVHASDRDAKQKEKIREAYRATDKELSSLLKKKSAAANRLKSLRDAVPKVMVMEDLARPRGTYILDRGLYNQPGAPVVKGVPAFLRLQDDVRTNRLDLARWLVSPAHPLTSRVAVNRFWQMLFGTGLVKTAEDFGVQGEHPIQRELLDWLAAEFVESGWDVKRLLKTIVMSETYRRDSRVVSVGDYERDPENRFLARGPRFRMPSWMIRDQALAASGLLNPQLGGPPVNPYQPAGIWAEATFGKKSYEQDTGKALYRRSLYTFWRRIVGPPIFFDSAKRQVCEVKPLRTNTPMHALTTLNDVTYVEAARAFAERVTGLNGTDSDRLNLAARRVLSRDLTDEELRVWLASLQRVRSRFESDPDAAARLIQHGDSKPNPDRPPVVLAAWTAVLLNLLNLDEALNKE